MKIKNSLTFPQWSSIILMPLRIIVSVLIFTPIYLLLILFEKIGCCLSEGCGDLASWWIDMNKEWQYITNGNQRKQAIEALRENKNLKDVVRLLRDSEQ